MANESIQQKFIKALDLLVEEVKEDRSVLAAILCGSLSHDTVWEKSDIDLVLVTIDDFSLLLSVGTPKNKNDIFFFSRNHFDHGIRSGRNPDRRS